MTEWYAWSASKEHSKHLRKRQWTSLDIAVASTTPSFFFSMDRAGLLSIQNNEEKKHVFKPTTHDTN